MSIEDRSVSPDEEIIEFWFDGGLGVSSDELIPDPVPAPFGSESVELRNAVGKNLSPVQKELATPKLPSLRSENRARLQMQSPNRLYFYWSLRDNPFQSLKRGFGSNTGSYTLVMKLVDLKRDIEELYPIEADGEWWFNVNADTEHRVEIGFYAPNRPFVRIMYSNAVQTPRKSPSPLAARDQDWRVPAQKFAQVLDVAGFKQDAFDVAITGDDAVAAGDSSRRSFALFSGKPETDFAEFDSEELRYAMLALAGGATLEQLRSRVTARLFALLNAFVGSTGKADALSALRTEFEIESDELLDEEVEYGPDVFGSSLVNFPQRSHRLRTRPRGFDRVSKFEPVSSPGVW
ncbi:hypothetical protein BH24ACI3_BH24ACI3_05740 [soil metagenome]